MAEIHESTPRINSELVWGGAHNCTIIRIAEIAGL